MEFMRWCIVNVLPWIAALAVYGVFVGITYGHVETWCKRHSSMKEEDRKMWAAIVGGLWPVMIPVALFYVARVGIDPQTRMEKESEQIERDRAAEERRREHEVTIQFRNLQQQAMESIQNGLLGIESGSHSTERQALDSLRELAQTGALPQLNREVKRGY